MELNHNCIRDILVKVQKETDVIFDETTFQNYEPDEVQYHIRYCDKLGCFNKTEAWIDNSYNIVDLSPYGHAILQHIKDDTVFKKIKTFLVEKGLPFALDTIIEALKQLHI
ncbi:MAG: DUF2513 domain-containing protein [Clostridia bacterium]|nr:DUF2513 domain-containing protein [Clostridia bacterium]